MIEQVSHVSDLSYQAFTVVVIKNKYLMGLQVSVMHITIEIIIVGSCAPIKLNKKTLLPFLFLSQLMSLLG